MKLRELKNLALESLKGKWLRGFMMTFIYFLTLIIFYFALTLGFIGIAVLFASQSIIGASLSYFLLALIFIILFESFKFGWNKSVIKLSRNQEGTYFEFFTNSFKFILKICGVVYNTFLKLLPAYAILVTGNLLLELSDQLSLHLLGSILEVVGTIWLIIKELLYVLNYFILADEPELSSKEIVEKSELLMKGNRVKYFRLMLSFIGWIILSIFVLIIALIILSSLLSGFNTLIVFALIFATSFIYIQTTSVKFYEDLSGTIKASEEVSK